MHTGLFEALPDALVIVDAQGRIVRANDHAHHLFGFAPGGLVGRSIEDLIPEDVRARHREHRAMYAATPRVRPMGAGGMALVGRRRDGEHFPVEIALSPVTNDAGQMEFLALVRDVSETLRARQALARARYDNLIAQMGQEALEARSTAWLVDRLPERLATTMGEDVEIGLCLRNDSEGAEWVAVSGERVRNIDPQAILDARRAEEEDEDGACARLVAAAIPESRSCALASLSVRGHASGMLVAWSTQPERFGHDAQHLLQSTATLVSSFLQRKQTEEQLAHAQRLESLGQLTGGIAHDFNNLLTVMSGTLQLMAAEPATPTASNVLIESALRAVRRGADLTDKLLSFARRRQLRPTPIDAARLLHDVRVLLERTLGEAWTLEVSLSPDVPPVFADAAQLDAALVNLAFNARDAMADGGRIAFSVDERSVPGPRAPTTLKPGRYVVFAVGDSGKGMPPEVLARAIEPFFSTKGGRGSGLGLSMVYGFVQQSGGELAMRSTPGVGTRVEVWLPVADQAASVDVRQRALPVGRAAESGRALVVEDDEAVRMIAAAFVRSLGYTVDEAADCDAALARLEQEGNAIDLVFSDVMLGNGPDGVALAETVHRRWPAIGIVLTSGHAHGSEVPRVPGIEMLAKPYDREQLAAAVVRSRGKPGLVHPPTG